MSPANKHLYQLSSQEALYKLETTENGLTDQESASRLKRYGYNRLSSGPKLSALGIFIDQFKNLLIIILLIALTISIVIDHFNDALIIGLAVVTNTVFGFIQEYKAHQAFASLKRIIKYQAKVKRDGKINFIDSENLVFGDIVILERGDRVLADGRLIKTNDLKINESTLTGESIPVNKNSASIVADVSLAETNNMAWSGTSVVDGTGEFAVAFTGIETEIGKIAESLSTIKTDASPLQKKIQGFTRWLALIIIIISVVVLITGLWAGRPFDEMFLTAIAVAVSALPEGLAVGVTVILAIGMRRILKRKALVRRLLAAETLGATTVICTDKTGTLTKGKMQVDKIMPWALLDDSQADNSAEAKSDLNKILEIAALCNNAYYNPENQGAEFEQSIHGSPTEKALLMAALEAGLNLSELKRAYLKIDESPFSSEKRFMATLHLIGSEKQILIKGAPEKLIPYCERAYFTGKTVALSLSDRELLINQITDLTSQGFRLLLVGYKIAGSSDHLPDAEEQILGGMIFVGLIGLRDPIRKTVKKTLKLTRRAGIDTLMITGDHPLTAKAIAIEIGLIKDSGQVLTGLEMNRLTDPELLAAIYPIAGASDFNANRNFSGVKVFARVGPQDKLRLVRILKDRGEIVAMTGDGVNDAPALVKADIGVALGSGTDVARDNADVVLLHDNFSVLVKAIQEGRVIFANIQKLILYLLSGSFSEIVLILGGLLLTSFNYFAHLPLPLTAAQILWINLITDSFPSFVLTFEPRDPGIMSQPPKSSTAPILNSTMKFLILLISSTTGLMALGIYLFFWLKTDLQLARTMAFAALGLNSLIYVFSVRSLNQSIWKTKLFGNRWLVAGIAGGLLFQLMALYLPPLQRFLQLVSLNWIQWLIIIGESLIVVGLIETVKWFYAKKISAVTSLKQAI